MTTAKTTSAKLASELLPTRDEEPSPARIEAFSDGVFSIIITLLVLDLRVPREALLKGEPLVRALLEQWPVYVAYLLSFLQVGVVWSNHHTMFHHIKRSDHLLLVSNLLLLLFVALLPFTTAVMSEYAQSNPADLKVASFLYSATLCSAGIFFNLIWRHAVRRGLIHPQTDPNRIYALTWHWSLVPVFYAIAFLLAFVNAYLSVGMYVLLLLYFALPGPGFVRWMIGRRARWQRVR
jgi:uncharacterized membrane protein